MQSKIFDTSAVLLGAAAGLFASAQAINTYLQMVVLVLTIIFMGLGIAMRARKIRGAGEEEE